MKTSKLTVGLVFLTFFVISFLTNIMGPLIPDIINSYHLSLGMVGFLPFSFFAAYGVMSTSAGVLLEKYREKKVMAFSFLIAAVGSLLFGLFPYYAMALVSLFLIGIGMAALQVAINPLLRVSGGEEHFAFNSVMAQLFFGLASFLSPLVYSYLVTNIKHGKTNANEFLEILSKLVPENLNWVSLYWIFALTALAMVLIILLFKFPKFELEESEKAGTWSVYKDLLQNKTVLFFFFGTFAYVGTEQGIANWMSKFLSDYHQYSPQTIGAEAVAYFWGLLTAGCLLGLVLLKFLDSRKVLILFATAAIISLTLALFGAAEISLYAFPLCGFALSVMWSVVFSLALNSLKNNHGAFSGILCTGIVGGAVTSLIIGKLGDIMGLRYAMTALYITLGYILSIGFWAKPLVNNATINLKKTKENQ
ncbi:MFS transporter [Flavobacterium poyangense]|uniref:MFS transporter n=1 Tax=Flavobacterium poyangense TaxID=2204302 RepID=UPI001421D4BB|nr:MFS transporter [Flavobacterium sp. JXAS1]